MFSNDRVYVSSSVALNSNNLALPFWQYIALCAESIRINKIAAEKEVAEAWATNVTNTWWITTVWWWSWVVV
jgi:hypothetical protein